MNIWREIKNGCIYYFMYLFDLYVDAYLWLSKQDIILALIPSNQTDFEPESKEWVSICSLYFAKRYQVCITYTESPVDLTKEYIDFYNDRNGAYQPMDRRMDFEIKEHLFFAKKGDAYISRTYFTGYKSSVYSPFICTESKSDIVFTYIEYTNPKMRYTIEIILPDELWIVGNEICTPAFVLRMLKHQSDAYIFDLDYRLHIVDHNVKDLVLGCDDYILIEKNGYCIQHI